MKISGFLKNSFIDYPGLISAVVFTPGCNMNCWYCHNRQLIDGKESIDENEVFSFLEQRKGMIDAVVISGGEPTLQEDLEGFIDKVKEMGFKIKLDTNGLRPNVLKLLLKKGLIDYVAMDLKAPFDRYASVTGKDTDINEIKESISVIMTASPDYEFRTTMVPDLSAEDIEEIAKDIKGAKRYFIQQYVFRELATKVVGIRLFSHPIEILHAAKEKAAKYVQFVSVRG